LVIEENQQVLPKDSLEVPLGHITWSKTKKIQEELIGLIQDVWVKKLQIC
jgi:hypothetical protein